MVKLIHTIAAILTLLLAGRVAGWEKRRDAHGKTIIAYYASWQWYDRSGLAKPSNLDHSLVTRYTFAFFQINEQGDIWGTDAWGDPNTLFGEYDWNWVPGGANTYCSWDGPGEPPTCAGHKYHTGLISQAHAAGVEIYPSIGGWTLSDPFSKLAENPAARTKFAENCVKLIEDYDFDGIDIDWEYPGYAPHNGRDVDTVNYSLFLKEIRDKLDEHGSKTGRFYGLTAALPCGPDLIKNIQIDVVKDIMTEFNLMTYDFHGSWNPTTGVNAPLYDQTGSPDFSVHGCVKNWLAGGARPDQINIGLPFYGRSFAGTGLTGIGDTHIGKADVATWSDDEGSPQYFNIAAKIDQFTSVRDEQTMTQFAYNHAGWVSYDDERAICDKCEYALDHSLNGYIIWEISGDLMPDLSQPLLQACNDRINDPGLRCNPTMEDDPWYAHPGMQGVCVNDGNQAAHYISKENEYTSAEACCNAHYGTYPECLGASISPGSTGKWHETMEGNPWYPHNGYCLSDGNHASFFITDLDKMFVSAEACCNAVYNYDSNCIANSNNPPNVDSTQSESQSNGNSDDLLQYVSGPTYGMYYPHYSSDDGSSPECRNDGGLPLWITSDMMKASLVDCCKTYFFPAWSGLCISGNEPHPYYPDYTKGTCRNDGKHPDWQTGDYLTDNHYTCCSTHFGHDSDLLDICSGTVTSEEG
mmetsp:Transcript_3006/g.6969  ORF Transcript_3006/g.6969 Transcript_3006/m.6969 type:complete len:694 (-) Transcript_3006:40-2121(-)